MEGVVMASTVSPAFRKRYEHADDVALHDIAQQLVTGMLALFDAVRPFLPHPRLPGVDADRRRLLREVESLSVGERSRTLLFLATWTPYARKLQDLSEQRGQRPRTADAPLLSAKR